MTNALYLLLFLTWPVLGWWGDRPRAIHPDEPTLSHASAWTSVAFYGLIALFTLGAPMWGLAWAAWVGLILARRLAASSRYEPVAVRIKDLVRQLRTLPWGLPVLGAVAANHLIQVFISRPNNVLGDAMEIGMLFGTPAVIGLLAWAGWRHANATRARWADRRRLVPQIASIFGVAASVVEDQAGLSVWSDGIQVSPVPPAIAAKLGPANRAQIDTMISQVLPGYELDNNSDHTVIRLVPVSHETASRRDALVASGGLLAGVSDAGSPAVGGDLILSEDDLR